MNIFLFSFLLFFKPAFAVHEYASSSLILISGPAELCSEGTMRVVGEKDEAVLMVGPIISFPLLTGDTTVPSADGKCRETTKRKIEKNKISQTSITSNCPAELRKLESTILQELEILPEQVVYKRIEGKSTSTCLYQRKLK